MKSEDSPTALTKAPLLKKDGSETGFLSCKTSRYKLWALCAILLLAFWSVFTGSVTLKSSSAVGLTSVSDNFDSSFSDDLDVLEVEEQEKVVKNMWNVYSHSTSIRLPRFWLRAFEAAYEQMVSDVPAVRTAAVLEIAKISLRSMHLDPLPDVQSKSSSKLRKNSKQSEEHKGAKVSGS